MAFTVVRFSLSNIAEVDMMIQLYLFYGNVELRSYCTCNGGGGDVRRCTVQIWR